MFEAEKLAPIRPAAISVVVPVYNQEAALGEMMDAWTSYLTGLGCEHEILLVDESSTDGTTSVAESLAARQPSIRAVRLQVGSGFGAGLQRGLELARHPLLAYCDGQPSYRPSDLQAMLKWIDEVHVVAGYRVQKSRPCPLSWRERASRWLIRRLFGVAMRDLGCLFLLARRAVFVRIPIQSDGPFAHVEVLAKANFLGCLMTEVPVECTRVSDQGSRVAGQPSTLREARQLLCYPDFGPAFLTPHP
jgi:glycosyltransferase involved in cell wall biosynthesis